MRERERERERERPYVVDIVGSGSGSVGKLNNKIIIKNYFLKKTYI